MSSLSYFSILLSLYSFSIFSIFSSFLTVSRVLVFLVFPALHYFQCHDLAKWLSHYLYLFSFSFYYTRMSTGKCHMTNITCHKDISHEMGSHDECGKVVHRSCSSCISSVQNPMGTLLSLPCQLRLGVSLSHLG